MVHVDFEKSAALTQDLEEFHELATSAGASVVAVITCKREAPDPKYFIGSGKAEEVRESILVHKPDLVIFNNFLSPAQERNLEKFLQCRVLDRASLILDIFAQRARSFEGKLQVELAQLEHLATRLVRGWTHLERQRGGIGVRGGPGESQLELDRRILRQKVTNIKQRLAKLAGQRLQNRRARARAALPTIALVGYTNAGKSTLFNLLTSEKVYVADKLFATLDPTLRRIQLPGFGAVIIADTVGFIRDLPHELIKAFHATLEETREADLLLHVIDASDPRKNEKIEVVNKVLKEIGASQVRELQVLNKIDLLDEFEPRVDIGLNDYPVRVWMSSVDGRGVGLLVDAIKQITVSELSEVEICLLPHAGQIRAALYQSNAILSEAIDEYGNSHLKLRISHMDLERIFA
ncbi:ribosome rescue factor HflX [Gammaproteobacteria bacterium]